MSALSQFMHTARAVLDEQDRKATQGAPFSGVEQGPPVGPMGPDATNGLPPFLPSTQPPFFVRTTWLFVELEELALPTEAATFEAIKGARFLRDIGGIGRLVDRVHAGSATLDASIRHQRQQLCGWIKDQIKRETK